MWGQSLQLFIGWQALDGVCTQRSEECRGSCTHSFVLNGDVIGVGGLDDCRGQQCDSNELFHGGFGSEVDDPNAFSLNTKPVGIGPME